MPEDERRPGRGEVRVTVAVERHDGPVRFAHLIVPEERFLGDRKWQMWLLGLLMYRLRGQL